MHQTERLILAIPSQPDFERYFAIHSDPQTNLFNPNGPMNLDTAKASFSEIISHWEKYEFGNWAIKEKTTGEVIGFGGLSYRKYGSESKLNLGYRFDKNHWGKGYATEAASAVIAFGFEQINLAEIIAFTAVVNQRSQAVMQRLGMQYQYDFAHPDLAVHHPLSQHCLYKIKAA